MIELLLLAASSLPTVEVSGSRAPPGAATVLVAEPLLATRPLADWLAGVPGLHAAERSNAAQDLQLSSRGFGARTSFGVRGLRLYIDGVPASAPDGSGSLSQLPLELVERIEVLRGPFSALYGANSGGVIAVFTAPARDGASAGVGIGAFGERELRLQTGGRLEGGGWRVALGVARVDGFRPQQAARKRQVDLRLDLGRWRLGLNGLDLPAEDAQGLSRAAWDATPNSTAAPALQFATRKHTRQLQLGLSGREGAWQLAAWLGRRGVDQWQSIPVAAQQPASHPGGVIALQRRYAGLDLQRRDAIGALQLLTGVAVEAQQDERRGYENFVGSRLGVSGALRRDEGNRGLGVDAYLQGTWREHADRSWNAGLRAGRLRLSSRDRFLGNGDDSGERRFDTLSPVLGVEQRLLPGWRLHAQFGAAQETPTLNELAYRADGSSGFNQSLRAQRSRQWEIGIRGAPLELSVFAARSRDEIVAIGSSGGRARFGNADGGIRRAGAELGWQRQLAPAWSLQLSASLLRARLADGSVLPGAPARQAQLALEWQPAPSWRAQLRVQGKSRLWAGPGQAAPGHGLAHLQLQRDGRNALGAWRVSALVDNLTDRRHAPSVIVAEANGRYLEPGPPRRWSLRLSQALD